MSVLETADAAQVARRRSAKVAALLTPRNDSDLDEADAVELHSSFLRGAEVRCCVL